MAGNAGEGAGMSMQRRGFLKACAALLVAPMIEIPDFRLIVPSAEILPEETWFSTVREMAIFDTGKDAYILRYDILLGETQLGVDALLKKNDISRGGLAEVRDDVATLLRDSMRAEGLSMNDLKPLPIPYGYVQPDFLRA